MKKPAAMTYQDGLEVKITADALRNKLKLLSFREKDKFNKKYPHFNKYFANKGIMLGKIREHSARLISSSALAGSLILNTPVNFGAIASLPKEIVRDATGMNDPGAAASSNSADLESADGAPGSTSGRANEQFITRSLGSVLPKSPRPLNEQEEKFVELLLKDATGIKIKANLEGEHLNTTYGYIGYEQHLRRYPGDDISNHGPEEFTRAGIAPGLGAWGYFAKSKAEFTPDLAETEKWYAVVQTLYLPDWNTRFRYLRDWYRYRKVLIINTKNGNAVVAAIADSGPAAWTGKQFGASPEAMNHLGGLKYRKGSVLVFFVDDPENKVPLGPVKY